MSWLWLSIAVFVAVAGVLLGVLVFLHVYVRTKYMHIVLRIFREKPLFIIPRGEPVEGAEEVRFRTRDGLTLTGCYLRAEHPNRKGVILFGLEFGSNCWSCRPYCEALRRAGYDVFAYEPRNQGGSDRVEAYDPVQWLTDYEVTDVEAAVGYLKQRADADPTGIGFFGISKGANSGLLAASRDKYIRCVVTDGAFATYTTMIPYMRRWVGLYSPYVRIQSALPDWFYGQIAMTAMRRLSRERGVHYVHIEGAVSRLRQPLFMIHGAADTYIKPEMGQSLFRRARGPKEFWVVDGAKHNQALHKAGGEYSRRVVGFFDRYLANAIEAPAVPADVPAPMPPLDSEAEVETV